MPGRYTRFNRLSRSTQNKRRRLHRERNENPTPSTSERDASSSDQEELFLEEDLEVVRPNEEIIARAASVCDSVESHLNFNDSDANLSLQAAGNTEDDCDEINSGDSDSDAVSEDNDNNEIYADNESDYEDDADFNEDPQNMNELLYDGAQITVAESLIATLSLSLRHNITGTLLADILQLISLHCPRDSKCVRTLYKFNKYFSTMQTSLVKHFYCAHCFSVIGKEDAACPHCEEGSGKTYFIEGSVKANIQELYKRPGFLQKLQNRATLDRQNPVNYKDIYDGEVYKDLRQAGGFLDNDLNISFTWYTDGISIFKSSKFSVWPVYLMINELPIHERTKKENVVFAGLWFGEKKPFPNLFLQPLDTCMQELRQGIEVKVPDFDIPLNIKGIVICGTCDLPAKALFLNMIQYNGRFGCQKCKHEGVHLGHENVRVYPYEPLDLRTDEETMIHAQEAFEARMPVCGVKGPTILSRIVHQHMRATAVDVMHCVYEGVVKVLLNFWFSPNFSDHTSSMIDSIDLVDQRLAALTPPSSVKILPRSIKQHRMYWKAHEFKLWFFYYSIPCINDIMDEQYFDHYLLFVNGISLLSQGSITRDELHIAEHLLDEFVSEFENLYGLRNMSNNLHQILHLAENVRQFGPLWSTSCFPLEDLNGQLKRLVHGSNAPQLQIYTAVSKILTLTTRKNEILVPGSLVHQFCDSLEYKCGRIKRHLVTRSVYIVGKCDELLQLPFEIERTLHRSNILGNRYFHYKRLLKGKTMFMSTEYRRARRTNSTYALYATAGELDRIGKVRCFVRITNCPCAGMCDCVDQNYAIITPCVTRNDFSTGVLNSVLNTVHTILHMNRDEIAIDIERLKAVCYYCRIEETGNEFVLEPVNLIEPE